jgi:hypothetical protein
VLVASGYAFWRFTACRFNPENGNLPQRVMALPLLFGNYEFPPTDSDIWRTSQEWDLAWRWFCELGNDADAMNLRGRAASGLLAVALGVLVWRWSRQLFGIGPRRAQRIIRYVAIIGIRQLAYDRWIRGRTMS